MKRRDGTPEPLAATPESSPVSGGTEKTRLAEAVETLRQAIRWIQGPVVMAPGAVKHYQDGYAAIMTVERESAALAGRVDALTEALTGLRAQANAVLSHGRLAAQAGWEGDISTGYFEDEAAVREAYALAEAVVEAAAGLVPGRQDRPGKELGGDGGARGADVETQPS